MLRTSLLDLKAGEQCAMELSSMLLCLAEKHVFPEDKCFPEDNTCLHCVVLSLVQNELYCGAYFCGSAPLLQ